MTSSHITTVALADGIDLTVTDHDGSSTGSFLLLHGGGGVGTVLGFADLLARSTGARVLTPTHPGFGGTPRPASLASTRDLAAAYVALIDSLDLAGVTVVGNSFGGWIAAEMALLGSPALAGVAVVDGIGIEVDGHPVTNVAGLAPADLAKLSFHDPSKAPRPPAGVPAPSPDVAALLGYTGPTMSDPTLLFRLDAVHLPVRVIWGDSDGIVDPAYGRAYAAAIPSSTFALLPASGHLPQIESPDRLLTAVIAPW